MTKRVDFSRYSSIRIGPVAEVALIERADEAGEGFIIGSANNILVGPHHPPLCMLSKRFDRIHEAGGVLVVGAATPSGKLVSYCKKNDIADFEFLSRLPGTLGGIVKMNAGLKAYEIFNHLHSVVTSRGVFLKEQIDHGYRFAQIDGLILEARFTLNKGFISGRLQEFQTMRSNQPSEPSAGSCFKNPPGDYAGRLIESVGLKGSRIGAMAFSDVHANFLVNLGGGTFDDALSLIMLAQKRVYEANGIWLQNEVIVVDERFTGMNSLLLDPNF